MDDDQIKAAVTELVEAIENNDTEVAKRRLKDLISNVLCNLSDIAYYLSRISDNTGNR